MRIGIISDLHLEFGAPFQWVPDVDVLVLAGDIGAGTAGIDWCRANLPPRLPVVYVPGNHEFYGNEMNETIAAMKQAAAGTNVTVLSNNYALIDDVRFIGATLWTDYALNGDPERSMLIASKELADHNLISYGARQAGRVGFTPAIARIEHRYSREYLAREMDSFYGEKQVVVTHHAPSGRSIAPQFAGSPVNPCFASPMEDFVRVWQPLLWIHGHVHNSFDYTIDATRVIANPRGYPRGGRFGDTMIFENPQFNPGLIVDV